MESLISLGFQIIRSLIARILGQSFFSDAPCGLDIQYNKKAKLEKIAVKLYQEDEQESVNKLGIDEFFRIWSRREALIKAAGSSVFYDAPSTMWESASYEGYRGASMMFR